MSIVDELPLPFHKPMAQEGNAVDDWAVISVSGIHDGWPIVSLAAAPPARQGDRAYILQCSAVSSRTPRG